MNECQAKRITVTTKKKCVPHNYYYNISSFQCLVEIVALSLICPVISKLIYKVTFV